MEQIESDQNFCLWSFFGLQIGHLLKLSWYLEELPTGGTCTNGHAVSKGDENKGSEGGFPCLSGNWGRFFATAATFFIFLFPSSFMDLQLTLLGEKETYFTVKTVQNH